MSILTGSSPWQAFTRFAISGGLAACVAIMAYTLCAVLIGWSPLIANLLSYLAQLGVSYHLHCRFSFGITHGGMGSMARYAMLSVGAFACNSLWVWVCTHRLGLPAWTPLAPMIFVTPLMTFLLARYWVFAASDGRN